MLDNYIERYARLSVPPGTQVMSTTTVDEGRIHPRRRNLDLKPSMRRVAELGGHRKAGLESHFDPGRTPTDH